MPASLPTRTDSEQRPHLITLHLGVKVSLSTGKSTVHISNIDERCALAAAASDSLPASPLLAADSSAAEHDYNFPERPRPPVGRRHRPRATAPSRRTAAQATSDRALPSEGCAGLQATAQPAGGRRRCAGHKRPPITNPRSHPAFSAILSEWIYVQHAERRLQQVSRHGLSDEETKRSD